MQDIESEDYQNDMETSLNIGRGFQYSPKLAMSLISSPRDVLGEIFPLSPILFEESSLDQLWKEIPEKATTDVLQPQIKNTSIGPVRSRNGLKALSWRVKEIVESLGTANYKNVADELLSTLEIPQTSELMNDEKNIRRRVYDALNVLVAAKVIQKQGKKVMPRGTTEIQVVENEALKGKREQLRELVRKYAALNNLFERNSIQNKASQALPFPLMVIPIPNHSNYEISMKKNANATAAVISSDKAFSILQESTIITMMGLHKKISSIPQELKSLCGRFK